MKSRKRGRAACGGAFTLGLALLACGGAVGDRGDGLVTSSPPEAPEPTGCASPELVNASVTVGNQAELEALRGCSTVHGDLSVSLFEGVDLRPLSALERVEGVFSLGDENEERAPVELASLEGLESLRRVGSLALRRLTVPSLEGLASLREITRGSDPRSTYGMLIVDQCPELTDLRGLDDLTGAESIRVLDNPQLTSLAGLRIEAELGQLSIAGSPLRDIDALKPLRTIIANLELAGTSLPNVAALAGLSEVRGEINISGNAELVDLGGLAALASVQSIRIAENPRLQVLPALPALEKLRRVEISNNESLREALEWPALPTDIDTALFTGNEQLARLLTFSALRYAKALIVECNPKLVELNLGRLEGVEMLRLANNAQLDGESVPRFPNTAVEIGGNLGDAAPMGACL